MERKRLWAAGQLDFLRDGGQCQSLPEKAQTQSAQLLFATLFVLSVAFQVYELLALEGAKATRTPRPEEGGCLVEESENFLIHLMSIKASLVSITFPDKQFCPDWQQHL